MTSEVTDPWLTDGVKPGDRIYIHPTTRRSRFAHWAMRSIFRRKTYGTYAVTHVTSATSLTVKKDSTMKKIQTIFSAFTLIIAGLGLAGFTLMIGEAKSAPQEAALAAMVLAVVVPMYVMARCIEMVRSKDD